MADLFNFSFPDTKKYQAWTAEMKMIKRNFTNPMRAKVFLYYTCKMAKIVLEYVDKIESRKNAKTTETPEGKAQKAS